MRNSQSAMNYMQFSADWANSRVDWGYVQFIASSWVIKKPKKPNFYIFLDLSIQRIRNSLLVTVMGNLGIFWAFGLFDSTALTGVFG